MATRRNQKNKSDENKDLDFLKIQYQVIANRQLSHDNMTWNVPTLLFVVQSLLWTLALNQEVHPVMRCLISVISTVMGFMSIQLFERNRIMEIADSKQLYAIENFLKKQKAQITVIAHHQLEKRTVPAENASISHFIHQQVMELLMEEDFYLKSRLMKKKSFNLWMTAFWMIFWLSIVILLYNVYEALKCYEILNFLLSLKL